MPRPSRIIALGLEHDALALRNGGKTADQATAHLNETLALRGAGDQVARSVVERYWASLDKESIAPAHRPQVAEENARVGVTIGSDLQSLRDEIAQWMQEASNAKSFVYGKDGAVVAEDINWSARTSVAREFRETLKFTADVFERIYNMENIRIFQQTVLETIAEASPELQREVKRRFEANQQIVRAQMLGM
jgi:hypothetical protein